MNDNLLKFREYYKAHIDEVLKNSSEEQSKKVIKEFNKEFPLERLKKLKLDEYIYKGTDANTLASRLGGYYNGYGKKDDLVGPSISSGSINMKFGIHYQNNKYIDYTAEKREIKNPEEYYLELRKQLVEVLTNISNGNQDFDYTKYDHLLGMYNVILKIAYYINPDINITFGNRGDLEKICKYFGIEIKENDKSLNLSYRIRKFLDENVEESKGIYGSNTCRILYDYATEYIFPSKEKSKKEKTKEEATNNTVWLFQPGEQGKYWEDCKKYNKIILGFHELGDLTGKSIDELNELDKKVYNKKNPYHDKNCLNDFVNNMKIGDIVIIKRGSNDLLGYGTVKSDYYFDKNLEKSCRDVKWEKLGLWKNTIIKNVQKTLTNVSKKELDNYDKQLLAIINGEEIVSTNIGENYIYYGVPGCGKSYQVNKIAKSYDNDCVIRTVFHPDYTYSDFIGQIMPLTKNKNITYDRIPGPFTKALAKAYEKQDQKVLLIIEEINRGNILF